MIVVAGTPFDISERVKAAPTDAERASGVIDAHDYLRTSTEDETSLIQQVFLPAAVRRFEEITNRAVLRRTMRDEVILPAMRPREEGWRCGLPPFLRVPLPPLVDDETSHFRIVALDLLDDTPAYGAAPASEGNGTTVSASGYRLDTGKEPGRIYLRNLDVWPDERDRLLIEWTCGYEAASIPADHLSSILMLMALYYEQRDMVVDQGGGIGSGGCRDSWADQTRAR